MTNETATTAEATAYDFQIERKRGIILVTPLNHRAWDWCRDHFSTCVEWGQSYLMDKKRGNPLQGFLTHKEGFRVLAQ
jgi:hypothetical protein